MKKSASVPPSSLLIYIPAILLSLFLPFTQPFSILCNIIYTVCGLLILTGAAAARERKYGGSDYIGTFAGCLYAASALLTYLPEMDIPTNIYMITGGIIALKAATLLTSVVKFKRPLLLRTYLNRLTILILILTPLVWRYVDRERMLPAACAIAGAASAEELAITLLSHYPRPNRTALLQKRHIKHVLYGTFMKRSIEQKKASGSFMPSAEGINFIGDLSGSAAQAHSSRVIKQSLVDTGAAVFSDDHPSTKNVFIPKRIPRILKERRRELPYDVSLLRINPSDMPELCARRGPSFFRNNYIIAYWLWEQEHLNPEHRKCIELVDEIWTPSEFVSSAVRECTGKPVYTVPYKVCAEPDPAFDRSYFGLPENTLLYMISIIDGDEWERKNPVAAARAFADAFPDGRDNVGLIIKAPGASRFEQNEIKSAVGVGKKLYFFTKIMDKKEADSLIACCDVLISLHRGESFGMTMAEAMLLGKPVIASAWSANTEYMDSDCACLVDCSPAALEHECEPYHKGSVWAQPDENKAAGFIRQLYDDEEKREYIGRQAAARIKERFGGQASSDIMKRRIAELRETEI